MNSTTNAPATIRTALFTMTDGDAVTLHGIHVERLDSNNWIVCGRVWPIAGAIGYIERNGTAPDLEALTDVQVSNLHAFAIRCGDAVGYAASCTRVLRGELAARARLAEWLKRELPGSRFLAALG
jgi:hypothetical protein